MNPTAKLYELLRLETEDYPAVLESVQLLDWGRTLVFEGVAGEKQFTLRYTDCREMRWRAYLALEENDNAPTPVVDFAPGRDQHRSPLQILTGAFGVTLFYGGVSLSS